MLLASRPKLNEAVREADTIRQNEPPRTRESLAADLRALGIAAGDTLLVHSALSALGWVCGGASAVIDALRDVLNANGTLAMPAQSGNLSDPATWEAPPVPEAWHEQIRRTMPPFDPRRTPTRGMGRIAELFRTWPGVERSDHPTGSFVAWGRHARRIAEVPQPLGDPFGVGSPLSALLDMDASVLLLGVSFGSCTALHLAERLAWPDAPMRPDGSPVRIEGERRWVSYRVPEYRTDLFEAAGAALLSRGIARSGAVGAANAVLVPMRGMIELIVPLWRECGPAGFPALPD